MTVLWRIKVCDDGANRSGAGSAERWGVADPEQTLASVGIDRAETQITLKEVMRAKPSCKQTVHTIHTCNSVLSVLQLVDEKSMHFSVFAQTGHDAQINVNQTAN